MLVRQIGEFGLLGRISAMLAEQATGVVRGIGDDVAVLDTSGPEYLLATCDIQVEGVHFTRQAITPYQLGRKVAAINVSDIAAMGGDPRWALVSLAIPGNTEVEYVEELYRGMREQAALAGASIVGGNLSRMKSDHRSGFHTPGGSRPGAAHTEEHGPCGGRYTANRLARRVQGRSGTDPPAGPCCEFFEQAEAARKTSVPSAAPCRGTASRSFRPGQLHDRRKRRSDWRSLPYLQIQRQGS